VFDSTFWIDGVRVSILKRRYSTNKKAKQKRKKREKRKDQNKCLFPYFDTIPPENLQQYKYVVIVNPNWHDFLFIMHRLLEYKSKKCMDECGGDFKKWNRDFMAVLKFCRI